jgi:beta-lactamase regulating signal transducer with metallopeptidase domain
MTLLTTLLRLTIVLGVAAAMLPMLSRQSAAFRAWLLTLALACAAVLPALQLIAPAWGARVDIVTVLPTTDWAGVLLIFWVAGTIVHLVRIVAGVVRLMGIAAAADPIRDGRCADLALELAASHHVHAPVLLLEAERARTPVTWGHAQPKILLPAAARAWSDERARIVLCHEIAHVRRRDWLVQLFATIICSIYWPHPLVWWVRRRLRLECERACDDAVLRSGVDGAQYAAHLLELARGLVDGRQPRHATALLQHSTLERRVRSMLTPRGNRSPMRTGLGATTALGMLVLVSAVAGFGSTDEPAPPVSSAPVRRLTLLLDGRIMDLSKEWPTYPNPSAGLVAGPGVPGKF